MPARPRIPFHGHDLTSDSSIAEQCVNKAHTFVGFAVSATPMNKT